VFFCSSCSVLSDWIGGGREGNTAGILLHTQKFWISHTIKIRPLRSHFAGLLLIVLLLHTATATVDPTVVPLCTYATATVDPTHSSASQLLLCLHRRLLQSSIAGKFRRGMYPRTHGAILMLGIFAPSGPSAEPSSEPRAIL